MAAASAGALRQVNELSNILYLQNHTFAKHWWVRDVTSMQHSKARSMSGSIKSWSEISFSFGVPLSPAFATFLQSLQRYNSPADWARELFNPFTDSASLLLILKNNFFVLGLGFCGGRHNRRMLSRFGQLCLAWAPNQWANLSAQIFLETTVGYEPSL